MQTMENIINKSICSKAVQEMAKNSRLKEIDLWSLFFDTGCDYLDQLRHRIAYNSVFKAQFGDLMSIIKLNQTPAEIFKSILVSPYFWAWWSSQLWRVCYNFSNEPATEISMRLMFNTSLIPQTIIFKIFSNGEQKNSSKQTRVQGAIKYRVAQIC